MLSNEIVKILKVERLDRGLSYNKFGELIGCTGRTVSYWEKGQRIPRDIEVIERVLNNLGYEILIKKKGGRHGKDNFIASCP